MSRALHYLAAGLNAASAVFAILAAVRWYQSATFKVCPKEGKRERPEIYVGMKMPMIVTLEGQ
jgi:hypothetical protein